MVFGEPDDRFEFQRIQIADAAATQVLEPKPWRVAGVVEDGILPGYFGYETGQASFGDAYAWVARITQMSHAELNATAMRLPPGAGRPSTGLVRERRPGSARGTSTRADGQRYNC